MTEPKRSLVSGISRLAEAGALFAGDVAGLEVVIQDPARLVAETRGGAVVWDDGEERRYRDWVREKVQQTQEADFEEWREEETFRDKHRDETKKRSHQEVRIRSVARLVHSRFHRSHLVEASSRHKGTKCFPLKGFLSFALPLLLA